MNSSLAEVWQQKKSCWSAVPWLAVIFQISWNYLLWGLWRAQREDLADKFGAGGDEERRKLHTWKTKLAANSVLLSPMYLSGFIMIPSFIFCEATQQASKVRPRFYSLCKFSAVRSAKFLVFKWDFKQFHCQPLHRKFFLFLLFAFK